MSLDLWLYMFLDVGTDTPHEVNLFSVNITHNLIPMAVKAKVYDCMWLAKEHNRRWAKQLIKPLTLAIKDIEAKPDEYDEIAPANNWGTRGNFVQALESLREACIKYPKAKIGISR